MKRLLLLSIYMLVCSASFAQTHAEKKFIRMAIGKENIIYSKKISPGRIEGLKRDALQQDTLFEWGDYLMPAKQKAMDRYIFILTDAERAFVLQELDKMKGFIWKKVFIKNSLAIDFDEIKVYKKAHNEQLPYNPDNYVEEAYAFTKPIFFRNNTLCLFYLEHGEGGKLLLYIKEKGQWKLRLTPLLWIS